jgi:hypothetical protein
VDFDPMAVLGSKRKVQCLNCGEKVPVLQTTCPRCKAQLPAEAEDEVETVNVVSGPSSDVMSEVTAMTGPGAGKRNIDRLEEAYQKLADGSLPVDAFRARVGDVYKLMNAAVQLSKTDVLQEKIKGFEPEVADLYRQAATSLEEYLRGIIKMREYPNTRNLEDAEEGLNVAKAAVEKLLVIKEKADTIGARVAEELKAKAAEAAAQAPEA